ncbi:MAG: 50S ribosomal protein L35 [bacterium]|nr:50S ribosomal protein L35 [bacterium]
MKVKTHKALSKRVKATKTGKILRVQSASSHLLTHKSDRTKLKLAVSGHDAKKVRQMLPYL